MDFVFLVHLISTSVMFGITWIVQLVHYPSFTFIDKSKFLEFESFHCKKISFVVMPAMVAELLSGCFMFLYMSKDLLFTVSLIILGIIWISTFSIQSRIHSTLLNNYSEENVRFLITSNWIRTFLWTVRTLILIVHAKTNYIVSAV